MTEVILPDRIGWKTESKGSAFCLTGNTCNSVNCCVDRKRDSGAAYLGYVLGDYAGRFILCIRLQERGKLGIACKRRLNRNNYIAR